MDDFVLRPLTRIKLLSFLDEKAIGIIKYFIRKSLFSQPEVLPGQIARAVQVPKEHIEQWFVQAFGATPIGAGSYPIDVYSPEGRWGADIKMLNAKVDGDGNLLGVDSGEASLGQNFRTAGSDLDNLFITHGYEQIKDAYLTIFSEKINLVKLDFPELQHLYFFFILRAGNSFYLTGSELDAVNVGNVSVGNTSNDSVYLNNFIDLDLGNVKIYKAKKRLELRLRTRTWVDRGLSVRFTTDFSSEQIILQQEDINDDFLEERLQNIKRVKIDFN